VGCFPCRENVPPSFSISHLSTNGYSLERRLLFPKSVFFFTCLSFPSSLGKSPLLARPHEYRNVLLMFGFSCAVRQVYTRTFAVNSFLFFRRPMVHGTSFLFPNQLCFFDLYKFRVFFLYQTTTVPEFKHASLYFLHDSLFCIRLFSLIPLFLPVLRVTYFIFFSPPLPALVWCFFFFPVFCQTSSFRLLMPFLPRTLDQAVQQSPIRSFLSSESNLIQPDQVPTGLLNPPFPFWRSLPELLSVAFNPPLRGTHL